MYATKPIKILILEDNKDDSDLMIHYLNKNNHTYNYSVAQTKEEFENTLRIDFFNIIISDYNLVRYNAQDAFTYVKKYHGNIPFIICSDAIGEQQAIKLLKNGVRDILEKKNISKLPNVVERELENVKILEQKKKAEDTLHTTLETLESKIEERTKELQSAYKKIKISEERYNRILSSINDIVYSVDLRSKEFLYLSPAFEKILGYTLEDTKLMGGREEFLAQIIQNNNFSIQQNYLSEIAKSKTDANKVWIAWFKCRNGNLVCFEDKWTPIYENGILIGMDGILRNVTDRELTEENLKASEDRINSVYLLKQLTSFEEMDIYNYALTEICRLTKSEISFCFKLHNRGTGNIVLYNGNYSSGNEEQDNLLKNEMFKYFLSFHNIKEPLIKNSNYIVKYDSMDILLHNILAIPIIENGEVKAIAGILNKSEKYNDADVLEVDMYMNEMWKIVSQKKSEEKLRKLSAAVEQSPVAIAIADLQYIIEYINPKYTQMTGFTLEEVVGKTLLNNDEDLIDNNTYHEIMSALSENIEWRGELLNYKKNYEIYWESVAITPLKNIVDETTHFIMIKEDITDKQKVKELLNLERYEQKTALSLIAEGIIKTDIHEKILSCNKKVEDLFGFSNEEVCGITIYELFEKIELRLENDNTYFTRTMPNRYEKILESRSNTRYKAISKNKSVKIIIIDFTYLYTKHDETIGRIYILKDLTEIILKEQQINLSQKLESIGSLAAGIAHEINTPLQYVGDNNRFLQESSPLICDTIDNYLSICNRCNNSLNSKNHIPEDTAEELLYIKSEIPKAIQQSLEGLDRVSKIVRAMKDFAHPGGNIKNDNDINHNIEVTVNISRNKWKYCSDVELDLDPNLPKVKCYIDEINQVILNLIVNSAQAIEEKNNVTAREKGVIRIKTSKEGENVIITITDDGVGIPREHVDRIYDPFFTTKEVGKGTGQGLAISHDIITKKHSGRIIAESEPGFGSTFCIYLPIGVE